MRFDDTIYNESFDKSVNIFDFLTEGEQTIFARFEPRTRDDHFTEALSFKTFDPMWFLTRQWQYGRFEGNDCGSPITAKVKVKRTLVDALEVHDTQEEYTNNRPLEYDVEKVNRDITPFVRVESALYFTRMLKRKCLHAKEVLEKLMREIPLSRFETEEQGSDDTVENLKQITNDKLEKLYKIYGSKTFDGYRLFEMIDHGRLAEYNSFDGFIDASQCYYRWFIRKYMPRHGERMDNPWSSQKLGYDFSLKVSGVEYEAHDYDSGSLSWYSFDTSDKKRDFRESDTKYLSYLPTPALYPGSPRRNLWEFEDSRVSFGDLEGQGYSFLANAVIMQYVSMYGNDWLQMPLEVENGTVADIMCVLVKDTFGEYLCIDHNAQENDGNLPNAGFIDRWAMFQNTSPQAYVREDFSSSKGFFVPPTISRGEIGRPVEEVHFLRDEMANMVWAVEENINDGCGGVRSGKTMADKIEDILKKQEGDEVAVDEDAEYSYLFQNRVPVNWIPFIPQKIKGEIRDILFRRGRMPVFYNGGYHSVRPSTSILRTTKENGRVIPFVVNEEELSAVGVKVMLTPQRVRWYNGESFMWYGLSKKFGGLQLNSGLMSDQLIDIENQKNIIAKEKK